MKFSKLSQLFLVSTVGLLVATLLSACQLVTIDYVFVASSAATSTSSDGQIDIYAVDSQSGALRTGATTVSSGGVSPAALAVSADYANLYVANAGDNTVVHFTIASNGKLTSKDTLTLSDAPVSLAVSADGSHLFVVYGTTSATLGEYALSSGTIGSVEATEALTVSGSTSDVFIPTGVTVLANDKAVYATVYDQSSYNPGGTTTSSTHPGWVFGFAIGSSGALTATSNSPYQAGVKPSALAADPTNRFVYVTDYASNQLIGYSLTNSTTLNYMISGPFTTGSATNSTDTQPVAIAVDPALGRFVYTANYLGNSVSGFRLDPTAGTLTATQSTPYPSDSKPTAIAVVPHGNHSVQAVDSSN